MKKSAKNIKGYTQLPDMAKRIFEMFLNNFYNSHDAKITPVSVNMKKDAGSGVYIRFDYKIDGREV